jgi:crotonobetainyl-CoA:carnitine CoA-transferase CaiB-like acyl-CoA transferase
MGKMRRVKPPVQFGGQRLTPASDSPAHGEHTEAVLRQLGMSDEKITDLIAQGVVAAS